MCFVCDFLYAARVSEAVDFEVKRIESGIERVRSSEVLWSVILEPGIFRQMVYHAECCGFSEVFFSSVLF